MNVTAGGNVDVGVAVGCVLDAPEFHRLRKNKGHDRMGENPGRCPSRYVFPTDGRHDARRQRDEAASGF